MLLRKWQKAVEGRGSEECNYSQWLPLCCPFYTGLDGRDEPVEIRPTTGELAKKGEL